MPPTNDSHHAQNHPAPASDAPAPDSDALRRIVEDSPDWIQLIDPDGALRWINKGGQCALEIEDMRDYAGLNWFALWEGEDQTKARQAVESAATGRSARFRGYCPTATGQPRWWSVSVSSSLTPNRARALFVVARDITDAIQKEEAAAVLAAVASNSADAIIGFDVAGRITAWNRAAELMFGYTAQEAIGQSYTLIGATETHPAQHEIFQNVMRGHATRRYETKRRRKDGALIDVSIATSPLEIGGAIQGASAVLRDITEQSRTAEELRRRTAMMDALVQGTGSAIYMKDTKGRFLLANPVCLGILNRTAGQVLGFDETEVFDDLESAQAIMRDDAAIMRGGVERVLEELVPMNGKVHTFLSVKNPMFDAEGKCVGIMGVSTDITERKEHEAEIQDLNTRLHRAMQETHHRVKNNLQVISALTEIQSDAGATIPLSAIQRIGQHVRALAGIHDLLTQQIKADASNELISTKEILHKLLFLMQTMLKNRPITCQADDVRLTMDQSSSFAMLISELVSNAVKHGSGGIELTLTRQARENKAPLLRLEVCDDGPGFPPDFDPQAAANTGLELVDSLARWDLRGEVIYGNRAEGGSRVVVTFPGGE